jgi:hypothetical protein
MSNNIKTPDLALATTLALFANFVIERIGNNRALFVFEKNERTEQIIGKYWNKELKVEPQEFFLQLKAIKSRLYSENQND